jgi:hypothetical protein
MESEGHLTNWFGLQQETNPVGAPANGMRTLEMIDKLFSLMGYTGQTQSAEAVFAELQSLIELNESTWHNHGSFPTTDGKAHFALYSDQTLSFSAETPQVLEIDARMTAQMKLVRA